MTNSIALTDKVQNLVDFQKYTFKNYFLSKQTVFTYWRPHPRLWSRTFRKKLIKHFPNIFVGKSCLDEKQFGNSLIMATKKFWFGIFAHVWSVTTSPLLPGVGYTKTPTYSLKEITKSFSLEKKSGRGKNKGFAKSA